MTPTSHSIQSADLNLHYLEAGGGTPLILLHGGTQTAASWTDWIADLSARFHVYAPDTRGHGRTDNPAGRMAYDLFADDVASFIATLGLQRPLIVGYSDGGQTALEFGLRHPGKARALVLGGTLSRPTQSYLDSIRSWGMPAPGEIDVDALQQTFGPYLDTIKRNHSHHYGPDYWQSFLRQTSRLWLTLPEYSEAQLGSIADPTLVIMGDRDHLGGAAEALRLYQSLPRGELAIIPNASHEAVESPHFRAIVSDFLGRHTNA